MNKYFDDNELIMFKCDNCGRRLNGCTIVNGMMFCAKCYQETLFNKILMTDANNSSLIEELKQQLAEKENIIVEQKIRIRALNEENFLLKDDIQMAIKIQNKHDIDRNQTAIAELEKVKELLDDCKWCQSDHTGEVDYAVDWFDIVEKIDQQIKSLKGETDGKNI